MQKYSFYITSNDHAIDQNGNQTINENIKKSKIMIIGQSKNLNKETNDEYIEEMLNDSYFQIEISNFKKEI